MNARRWMKGLSVLLALILAAISALPMGGALAESDGMIRVKLTRLGAPSSIAFETTCDYYVYGHPEMRVSAGQKVTVSASDGAAVVKVGSASASFDGSVALMRSRSVSWLLAAKCLSEVPTPLDCTPATMPTAS